MLKESEIITIALAASPVLELRGAIPFAIAKGLSPLKSYFLSIIGNMLPVVPLYLFFNYLFHKLKDVPFLGNLLTRWFKVVERKSKLISTYGIIGLILFVAIPFPTTGAWTGTFVANLLKFNILKTLLSILLGIMIAGILVELATQGVIKLWLLFN
ncbi:MAG: ligand-binding protein SH3 [Candidatus Omnitrophota bacterium]|nr:MAG: ligand-binding protein SH3 [Candidatus Omnitrophota bacterium]RKY39063.1 MAG: ligand-binding protein SH3 [Candidatus Omnitrophota bacterium]RKY45744.1 MAG: ligand-binding protein SH3 [Candidatus Omnitrophota bacterium]